MFEMYFSLSDTGILEEKGSRTYFLLITTADALPLSCNILLGTKPLKVRFM